MEDTPLPIINGIATKEGQLRGALVYKVFDVTKHKDYFVQTHEDRYIQDGDIIAFKPETVSRETLGRHKNREIYVIGDSSDLAIVIQDDYKAVKEAIHRASNYNLRKANDFLNDVEMMARDMDMSVVQYLYYFSESEASNNPLYEWWLQNRVHRRLSVLGLTYIDIEVCKEYFRCGLGPLYDKITDAKTQGPLIALPLELEQALPICKTFKIKYTQKDLNTARIARTIYLESQNEKNAYIEYDTLKKFYPQLDSYKQYLADKYEIVFTKNEFSTDICYLKYNYIVEVELAEIIANFIATNEKQVYTPLISYTANFVPDQIQAEAIREAFCKKIYLILGGPGRGKTRIIKELVHNLQLNGIKFGLISFMGKAVSRLREVCADVKDIQNHAATAHRLIAMNGKFEVEHLIWDEVSMADTGLVYELLKMYPKIKAITFVGDKNQLQPLKWGSFLHQLLECPHIPRISLLKKYRQKNSIIVYDENDNLVNSEYCVIKNGGTSVLLDAYRSLIREGVSIRDIAIITAKNKEVDEINKECQLINNNTSYLVDWNARKFMLGDKVILKKNKKNIDQWNGDLGIVIDVDEKKKTILVEFSDKSELFHISTKKKAFPYRNAAENNKDYLHTDMLNHAYCLTVDSSQGSEWPYVMFYIPPGYKNVKFFNFYRINTAISRSQIKLWCIGDINDLQKYIKQIPPERHDNLCYYINQCLEMD